MRAALALLFVAAAACASTPPPAATSGLTVKFSLPSDHGALVGIPIADARVTVLDFFSPTCAPCKERVPALHAKQAELAAKGAKLVLVGVVADSESTEDARHALASWGVDAPFLVDRNGTGMREAGVTALPATIVLDRNGGVTWTASSTSGPDEVIAAVQR